MHHGRMRAAQLHSLELRDILSANTALCIGLHRELMKNMRRAKRTLSNRISKCEVMLDASRKVLNTGSDAAAFAADGTLSAPRLRR